jgi:hypothetical protein
MLSECDAFYDQLGNHPTRGIAHADFGLHVNKIASAKDRKNARLDPETPTERHEQTHFVVAIAEALLKDLLRVGKFFSRRVPDVLDAIAYKLVQVSRERFLVVRIVKRRHRHATREVPHCRKARVERAHGIEPPGFRDGSVPRNRSCDARVHEEQCTSLALQKYAQGLRRFRVSNYASRKARGFASEIDRPAFVVKF